MTSLLSCHVAAQDASAPQTGWWWYREQPAALPVKPKAPPKLATSSASTSEATTGQFSPEWIRQTLPKLKDLAIANPTSENVTAYMALQKLAIDRSDRFAQVVQMVVADHPELGPGSPTASAGSAIANDNINAAGTKVVASLSGRVGIWFFFRSDCPYCHADLSVLQTLAAQTGIKILPISLDGQNISPAMFPDFVIDSGQASRLGVTSTPTYFLVDTQNQDTLPLAEGYQALPDMMQHIVEQAYSHNWISEEQYESTRLSPVDLNPGAPVSPETQKQILPVVGRLRNLPTEGASTPYSNGTNAAQGDSK
ncbi:MAG: conjugal transfer protein TraF [Rhodanobacter sp.]